jgi:hypothetical protein
MRVWKLGRVAIAFIAVDLRAPAQPGNPEIPASNVEGFICLDGTTATPDSTGFVSFTSTQGVVTGTSDGTETWNLQGTPTVGVSLEGAPGATER